MANDIPDRTDQQSASLGRRQLLWPAVLAASAIGAAALVSAPGRAAAEPGELDAETIGYQPGRGLAERTVAERLRDRVSAKDYGAVGDGRADDTRSILHALNDLAHRGRRELFLPAGTYLVRDLGRAADGMIFVGDEATFVDHRYPVVSLSALAQLVDPSPFAAPYVAVGDGKRDDTKSFAAFEKRWQNRDVDLGGRTCRVEAIPTRNRYFNGIWLVGDRRYATVWTGKTYRTGLGQIALGDEALAKLPVDYQPKPEATVIGVGFQALANATKAHRTIAIGSRAMANTIISQDNIAIGSQALRDIQSTTDEYDQASQYGTRNIAIGGNAGLFLRDAYGVVAVGRNAMSGLTSGRGGVAIGQGAVGGYAPVGLSEEIENGAEWGDPEQMIRTVGVGVNALARAQNPSAVAVGGEALANLKKSSNNVAIGARALVHLEANAGPGGGAWTALDIAGSYTHTGNELTLDFPGHGAGVGDIVQFRLLTGASQTFQFDQVRADVTEVAGANRLRVRHPISRNASGDAHLYGRETSEAITTNARNTAVGTSAGAALVTSANSVYVGELAAGVATDADRSVIIGRRSLQQATTSHDNVIIGHNAAGTHTGKAAQLTVIGSGAVAEANDATVIGAGAGTAGFANAAAIGRNAQAGSDDQFRLGNPRQTVWADQPVVTTADTRSAESITDSPLGLDFLNRLRPVDYRSTADDRLHHGLVAQEVGSLLAETGIRFGGYHDESTTDGRDELGLSYTEFIAPLINAVQELSQQNADLTRRVAALETRLP